MKTFKVLNEFFKENKIKYILGIIILIIADLLQLVMPRLLGKITDSLVSNSISMKEIYYYIFLIIGIAVLIGLCRLGWRIYIMGSARNMEFWLRNKFFSHLETLSTKFYNNNKTGDLMAHATNDIQAVRMAFGPGIVMATDALFFTLFTIITMIINIDVKLTLIALIPLPIIAILIIIFGKEVEKRFKIVQDSFAKLTDRVQESTSGIRVVKSFVQEENEIKKFGDSNKDYVDKNMKLIKMYGFMYPMVTFISALSFIISLFYGGYLVIDNKISLGQLVSFITYLGLLTWPMMAIGGVVNMFQRGTASMERLNEIFYTMADVCDNENTLPMEELNGKIQFNNLTFTYPESKKPALKNINISVEQGKTLAIVGRTGSGKSTLANLILRTYNTPKNSLLIDGIDINNIPLNLLRENIGYVPQDNFLFSKSIKDNIAFYNKDEDFKNIEEAAKVSQVYDEIMSFPLNFETKLGERGVNLSGGQKQRISISRAIIKKPKILILDDCLSAVDSKTEKNILEFLKEETESRTSIIISHRLSTIKDADEIIVLENGEIIERGTHEELLEHKGFYSELHRKQELSDKLEKEA